MPDQRVKRSLKAKLDMTWAWLVTQFDAHTAHDALYKALEETWPRHPHGVEWWTKLRNRAKNRARNMLRNRATRKRHLDRIARHRPAHTDETPLDILIRTEERAILLKTMGQLTESEHDAFLLCAVYGLPVKEAAGELGVSPGALSQRLRRARKRLSTLAGGRYLYPSSEARRKRGAQTGCGGQRRLKHSNHGSQKRGKHGGRRAQ